MSDKGGGGNFLPSACEPANGRALNNCQSSIITVAILILILIKHFSNIQVFKECLV